MDNESSNKHWAKAYLLDPLTAPEPSQETGPGSSHYNALRSIRSPLPRSNSQRRPPQIQIPIQLSGKNSQPSSSYPTPPGSDSPSQSSFHSSNPYSSSKHSASPSLQAPQEQTTPPNSPPSRRGPPPNRPASAQFSRDLSHSVVQRSASTRTYKPPVYQRRSVLPERFPGDMTSRPLEMLKQSNRAAERDHYTRHKPRKASETDIIDSLDTIGGTYHHGGPYDATLMSRNVKEKYSPVAAVEESNREALRATPGEFIHDSLQKHRPLQGTAKIPPGERDLSGNIMDYEEGADLMRETDAPGGPYRRWHGVQYHPDDHKGKGEPSFTIERDAKGKEADNLLGSGEYELQSGVNNEATSAERRREDSGSKGIASSVALGDTDNTVGRRNSTGKRLSDGLKKRFGSLRGRKEA